MQFSYSECRYCNWSISKFSQFTGHWNSCLQSSLYHPKTSWDKHANLVSSHSGKKGMVADWRKCSFNISHFFSEQYDLVQSSVFQRKTKKAGVVTCEWYILPFFPFQCLWRTKSPPSKWEGWLRRKGVHLGSDTSGSCSLLCCRLIAGVYIQHPDPTCN